MLDRLPVELLEHILRLAAPLRYSPDIYQERRDLLRCCSLVDKRIRALAQPMLSEIFVVSSKADEALLQVNQGNGRRLGDGVKLLSIELDVVSRSLVDIEAVVGCCLKVVDLRLSLELALEGGGINLDALRYHDIGEHRLPDLPSDLLQQLDVLVVASGDVHPSALQTLQQANPLYECYVADLPRLCESAILPRALRLYIGSSRDELIADSAHSPEPLATYESAISTFALYLNTLSVPTPLQVIVLADELRPERDISMTLSTIMRIGLLPALSRLGVEMIWHEALLSHLWSHHLLPPAYLEWLRVKQHKKEMRLVG
ncbi:hypothetical protein JCM11251_000733 [Rhodosporidiobolus azoricus]